MRQNKHIVTVSTNSLTTKPEHFVQVTCLMSDEELSEAQLERPDLVFTKLSDEVNLNTEIAAQAFENNSLPEEVEVDISKGITVRGMVMPYDIEEQAAKILNEEDKVKGKGVLR